jgi:ABC-type dipeptide/oligopeptide/nickel transport system permease subunit
MAIVQTSHPMALAGRAVNTSRWQDFLHRFRHSKGALIGLSLFLLIVLVAVFAPLIAPYDPNQIDPAHYLYSPGIRYLFGTD